MATLILIVEDEPTNMKLFRDLLKFGGYPTIEATDGQQGVKLARQRKPDLILMDVNMPVMDGREATRILKTDASTKHIPIVAVTSCVMESEIEEILRAGCDDYLVKPIDIKEFLNKVTRYLLEKTDSTT
jgi:two-component system cell cycle response regulator DivK